MLDRTSHSNYASDSKMGVGHMVARKAEKRYVQVSPRSL